MKVLFYSLFDISHEEEKTKSIFFHKGDLEDQADTEIQDVVEFANSTIKEADELTKVRDYYFESENTEVISQIKDILRVYIEEQSFESEDVLENLLTISKRYSRVEKEVIEKNKQLNTPIPSNLFYVLSQFDSDDEEEGKYYFFIAKIEKSEFLHSEPDSPEKVFKILKGLPHKSDGQKKSDKSWKTASIYFSYQIDKNDKTILDPERVIISDTNSSIATYWSTTFLEATEVNDDEKNTLTAYTEVQKIINNLNRSKDKTPERTEDINHFTNALNSYFLNNNAFDFEKMVEYVFSPSYEPVCTQLNMQSLHDKVEKLKDSENFDNNFSIIQKVIDHKTRQTIKVSDKIDIRIKKYTDDINDTISSEVDEFGNPFIEYGG